jgi:hypothetical protein
MLWFALTFDTTQVTPTEHSIMLYIWKREGATVRGRVIPLHQRGAGYKVIMDLSRSSEVSLRAMDAMRTNGAQPNKLPNHH